MRLDRFDALWYPVAGPDRERPLLGVWILLMLSGLLPVLPLVPFLGYLIRVLRASATGESAPPIDTDIRRLLVQGLSGSALVVVYLSVPTVVLFLTLSRLQSTLRHSPVGFLDGIAFYGGSTAALSLFILGLYLVPAGFFVSERKGVWAAVRRQRLQPIVASLSYFSYWVMGAAVLGLAGGIGALLLSRPRLGPVLSSFVIAYASLLASHLWGRGIHQSGAA